MMEHGFNLEAIRALMDCESWEDSEEGQIRRVWLGSIVGLTPSGKMYASFACSNLDACATCHGTGHSEGADCKACGGLGSREAYLDELWQAAAEEAIDSIGLSLEWEDGEAFVVEMRDSDDGTSP